jgi:hypothetical protein
MSVELAWHIKQWEKEKSNLNLIETVFDFIARAAEEKPLVVSEAIVFFVRKRQKPSSFEGLSVAECLIAFPDLPGIEQVQSSPLEMREFLRPYLKSAVEGGELPKNTDIETVAIMLEALHIGMLMNLHLKGAMRIRSMYHKQLQLIWDGLWAQSPEGHPLEQPEVEFVLN